jgi:hypothetical protein
MATYRITAPDGNVYRIQGPDNAPRDEIAQAVLAKYPNSQYTTEELKNAPSAPFSIKDLGLSLGQGLVGTTKSLTDILGVDNPISQGLGSLNQSAFEAMTPARKEEMAREAELANRAEGDTFDEIKAAASRTAGSPQRVLQSLSSAAGSSVPFIAASLIPGAQPAAGASLLARTAAAARGAGGLGALVGIGGQKSQNYEAVKAALIAKGVPEAEAEAQAIQASSYAPENLLGFAGAAGAGALEGIFGAERVLANSARGIASAENAAKLTAPTYRKAIATSMLEEGLPEGLQAAAGQIGQNLALNQAGIDTDITKGLAGSVTGDALVGAMFGFAVSPAQMSNMQRDYAQQGIRENQERQAKFDKERQEANLKAEQDLAKTKEKFMPKQEFLALPPPETEQIVEEERPDLLKNPLGNIKKGEIPYDIHKQIDAYRAEAGLPKLKDYSIEDAV